MYQAKQIMNDYKHIRGPGYSKLRSEDVLAIHKKTVKYIFENVQRDTPDQKVVVVTHMAPTSLSIDPKFVGKASNGLYYSDLGNQIAYEGESIDLWIHGHTHCTKDYQVGTTRVVCNPRGYEVSGQDTDYDPYWRTEL